MHSLEKLIAAECGTSLYSQPESMPGVTQIKTGSLEETNIPIAVELFVTRRRDYVSPVENAKQVLRCLEAAFSSGSHGWRLYLNGSTR
ncbi:uncharacterized protein N7482_004425 [Penicillium canariense]|uniref:Uncharacterized protein n=1 Tax=Penicillium canariense TaxID=189055 RepID=A0A9W9I6L2_9EURO|nr:uncharacterized protein N7482_004425 [Penicillium canariense]KAJ5168831.1 hypothetical protein N7482_004425 [Penicillium canariense]